jgi:hypothetical protein
MLKTEDFERIQWSTKEKAPFLEGAFSLNNLIKSAT